MYPVYQFMNSSCPPHQMDSAPHHHQHHPGYYYQSWPPHPAYGYLAPQPPYAHAPAVFYPGGYPAHPASYPVCYNCRPPYTMVEAPHYNRPLGDMSGYSGHCCGCLNHQPKRGGNVKIEEESPGEAVTNSSPAAWVPPGFMMNAASNGSGKSAGKAGKHSGDPEAKERSIPSSEQKGLLNRWIPLVLDNIGRDESVRQQENQGGNKSHIMNGWLPLIMDNQGFTKQGGDSAGKPENHNGDGRNLVNGWLPWMMDSSETAKQGRDSVRKQENQDADEKRFANGWLPLIIDSSELAKRVGDPAGKKEHNAEDKRPMSLPFIWMPYNLDNLSEDNGKIVIGEENTEDNPEVTVPGSEEKDNALPKIDESKNVPVKSVESADVRKIPKKNEEKMESFSSAHVNVGTEGTKSQKISSKSKPSSPPKSPKLPPICLRVDPVHKKKNGKGSSRSPSPPKDKEKLQQPVQSEAKGAVDQGMGFGSSAQNSCKDAEQCERRVKTIEVLDGKTREDANVVAVERPTNKTEEVSSPKDHAAAPEMDGKHVKMDGTPADKSNENGNVRKLSADEAATIIQSAYRGYAVRRWEPIKKLKHIADVRDQVTEIDKRIASNAQIDDKWRISIEETIMNLLLKLDTIQGLHPSIRDVRKSVAKELVRLQEKIDCLTCRKSEIVHEQHSGDKFDQDQEGPGQENVFVESSDLTTNRVHEVNSEVNEDLATAGLDRDNRETGATSEMQGSESLQTTASAETIYNSENEASTTIETSGAEMKPDTETMDLEHNDEPGHSSDFSVRQAWHNDVDFDASSAEAVADSTVSQPETEPRNGSDLRDLAQFKGDRSSQDHAVASSLDADATSLGAGDTYLIGTRIPLENEGPTTSDNLAVDGILDLGSSNVGNAEMASSVTDEVSALKEVSDLPVGHGTDDLLENSPLLQFELDNDKSLLCETVMENAPKLKGKELTHKEATQGCGDGDESSSWASYGQKDDNAGEDVNEKGTFSLTPDVNERKEPKEGCLELSDSLVSLENTDNSIEDYAKSDSGFHEIPVEQAPEEEASLIARPADNPEVHDEVLTDMEAEVVVTSSEDQKEIPLDDVKSCHNEFASTNSPIEVENCCRLKNYQNPPEATAEDGVNQSLLDMKDASKEEVLPPSPNSSQSTFRNDGTGLTEVDKKLVEENERLREAMQKLIEAGNEQLAAISSLSGRVKDLEKMLWRKNKLKMRGQHSPSRYASRRSCMKPSNGGLNEKLAPLAM